MDSSMQTPLAGRMLEHLRRRSTAMAGLAVRLVRAESPSLIPGAQRDVLGVLSRALERNGLRARRYRGRQTGGLLLALPRQRRKNAPYQLILGHCDTVWPIGSVERSPVRLEDGMLFGPGIYDAKAGLAQLVFALEALAALAPDAGVTPVVLINTDEEVGSPETTRHIRRLARGADRVLVLQPALGVDGRLKTARKGTGRFTIRAIGSSSAAGQEQSSKSVALRALTRIIEALYALNDPQRGTAVEVGTIDGGLRPNLITPESWAIVDVRVADDEESLRVEKAIRALRSVSDEVRVEVSGGMSRPPMPLSADNTRVWELAVAAADEMSLDLVQGAAGGSSDGNTASRFAPTLDGLGAVGDGAHAAHEFVFVDRMPERAALLARILASPPLG